MQKKCGGLAAALLGVALFMTGCDREAMVYSSGLTEETLAAEQVNSESSAAVTEQPEGYVYVCGAVKEPDVYPIVPDMRVFEAIELAGGFTEEADTQWLNQAETLQDGQKLYVYTMEETRQMQSEAAVEQRAEGQPDGLNGSNRTDGQSDGLVNINTADRELLMTLPGIGQAKADAVIRYRSERGAFTSIEEIQNVPGIKNAVFMKIKDRITVGS